MNKFVIVVAAIAILAVSCNEKFNIIKINGHEIEVEIVSDDISKQKGLSGRDSLAENSGMLFVFENPGRYTFWMKDMKFSLDFIWIRNGHIVDITKNVPVETNAPDNLLHQYLPNSETDTVLEVNAGWADKNDIKIGDRVYDYTH